MVEIPSGERAERALLSPEDSERGRIRLEKYLNETVEAVDGLPALAKEINDKLKELQETIQEHKESGARLTFDDLESIILGR